MPAGDLLYAALQAANRRDRVPARQCGATCSDILCAGQTPLPANGATAAANGKKYAYNDGDGSTAYDVEYPLQIHGFDPNFHFVGMTFNPEAFADMKDKYFLLNGRSYPDTVNAGPLSTQSTDGALHFSQPLPSIINIPAGGKALLRISDLDVTEYQTLASLGIPMQVIGINARLLRDQDGNNMYYNTNSITLGGGESLDVILDATGLHGGPEVLPLHPATRPPVERRRELRRHDDRSEHLQCRRPDDQGVQLGSKDMRDMNTTHRAPAERQPRWR